MSRWRDPGLQNYRKMLRNKPAQRQLIAIFGLLLTGGLAYAAPNPLRTVLFPEVRVAEPAGKEPRFRMIPATSVQQGAEVFYTVRATNESSEKLRSAVIVQAVPANTRFVEKSATGAGAAITYSIDGGNSFISSSELHSTLSEAGRKIRVTHIRWQFRHPLAPHVTVLARFRVVFE